MFLSCIIQKSCHNLHCTNWWEQFVTIWFPLGPRTWSPSELLLAQVCCSIHRCNLTWPLLSSFRCGRLPLLGHVAKRNPSLLDEVHCRITCPRLHCMTRPIPYGVKSSLLIALCTLPSDLALINTWRLISSSKFCSSVHLSRERIPVSAHRQEEACQSAASEWNLLSLTCALFKSEVIDCCKKFGLPVLPASRFVLLSSWITFCRLSWNFCASVAD